MSAAGPCVIVGAGAQGRVTLEVWRAARPDATFVFLDDAPEAQGREILGAKVVGPVDEARALGGEVVLALGNNAVRKALAARLEGVRFGNAVHPSATVSPSATLGPGTVVFAGAVVNTEAHAGAHVVINSGVVVEHDAVLGDFANLSPGVRSGGRIEVGEGAFVATGATLAPRVKVGAWSVVGAGAVVVREVPERTIAYGVPARVVGQVDGSFDWRRLL